MKNGTNEIRERSGRNSMEMVTVIGFAMVGTALAVVLKQYKPEYALLLSLVVGVWILMTVVSNLTPVLEELESMMGQTQLPTEYIAVLFKSMGICFLTQIAGDTCRDAGQNAMAVKVETAGKITILLLSLPLFHKLLNISAGMIRG